MIGAARAGRWDAAGVAALALAVRAGVVAWAAGRFPPAADGAYYHRLAERVGAGLGYTWLWPDGAVTHAAHYPVGYPAAIGALYAAFGPRPALAMALNAALGALAALAVHGLVARAVAGRPNARRGAVLAGALVALHPGLVAYTPALMTEGVTGALVACAAWVAACARDATGGPTARAWGWIAGLGLLVGAATLVRPQSLVLAPLLAALAWGGGGGDGAAQTPRLQRLRRAALAAVVATAAALLVCAPWTARNCARMGACALVSVNGGWNLLIGADAGSTGGWSPIRVPEPCREVWDEAAKDACFGREARRYIAGHPVEWLALIPRKLAATFDYCGAAGWYLHESSPAAFGSRAKVALGVVETLYERGLLALALLWAARSAPPRRSPREIARLAVLALGAAFLLTTHAWISHVALLAGSAPRWRAIGRGPVLPAAALGVLLSIALTHAVFFGSGRYGLVALPLVTGLAVLGASRAAAGDPAPASPRSQGL